MKSTGAFQYIAATVGESETLTPQANYALRRVSKFFLEPRVDELTKEVNARDLAQLKDEKGDQIEKQNDIRTATNMVTPQGLGPSWCYAKAQ